MACGGEGFVVLDVYHKSIDNNRDNAEIFCSHMRGIVGIPTMDGSGCKKPEMKTTPIEQVVLDGGRTTYYLSVLMTSTGHLLQPDREDPRHLICDLHLNL